MSFVSGIYDGNVFLLNLLLYINFCLGLENKMQVRDVKNFLTLQWIGS